jgi:hypothetical protein
VILANLQGLKSRRLPCCRTWWWCCNEQAPEGYWSKPAGGYSPKYRGTIRQIIFLAELGVAPPDERVQRGCEYLLTHSLAANNAFAASQRWVPSSAIHYLNSNLLSALLRPGYSTDPHVQAALDWQVQAITGQGQIRYYESGTNAPGFACAVNRGQPCDWRAVKAMKALFAVPPQQRTPAIRHAIEAGAAFLFSRDAAVADYP